MDENRPHLAFALVVAAGFLVLIEGALLLIVGNAANSLGYAAASALLSGLGIIGLSAGFFLVILAGALLAYPELHVGLGVLIIATSLVSFFGGGGFLIGIPIGVFGGVLALVFETSEEEERAQLLFPRTAPLAPANCWNCGWPWGVGQASCSSCGAYPRA